MKTTDDPEQSDSVIGIVENVTTANPAGGSNNLFSTQSNPLHMSNPRSDQHLVTPSEDGLGAPEIRTGKSLSSQPSTSIGRAKIQKRPSQTLPKRVHFADDEGHPLESFRYITPRNSMSMDRIDAIWAVLDVDKDGLLNFKELSYFAKTVFLDVQDSDVQDMLRKEDSQELSAGLNFTEWRKLVRNTDADVERLVDDLYRVFVLGEEITDPEMADDYEEEIPHVVDMG